MEDLFNLYSFLQSRINPTLLVMIILLGNLVTDRLQVHKCRPLKRVGINNKPWVVALFSLVLSIIYVIANYCTVEIAFATFCTANTFYALFVKLIIQRFKAKNHERAEKEIS